ncbi:MAG: glycosyltransferase 87 family protein, partial [Bdellovibrionota bacterium]
MKHWRKTEWLLAFFCLGAISRLLWAGWIDSMDFDVYWRTAQGWLSGRSPYFFDGTERGFVIKYPPWILPIFFPFGFLGHQISRMIWALLELLALIYTLGWVHKNGVSVKRTLIAAFFFWWIWLAHFFAGQLTLILLAAGLWAVPPPRTKTSKWSAAVAAFFISGKIFYSVSLLGLGKRFFKKETWLSLLIAMPTATFGSWIIAVASGYPESFGEFLKSWARAAASGGVELGAQYVRGQMNHGFTAGALRWLSIGSDRVGADIAVCLVLSVLLSAIWYRYSKKLSDQEKWSGWL